MKPVDRGGIYGWRKRKAADHEEHIITEILPEERQEFPFSGKNGIAVVEKDHYAGDGFYDIYDRESSPA